MKISKKKKNSAPESVSQIITTVPNDFKVPAVDEGITDAEVTEEQQAPEAEKETQKETEKVYMPSAPADDIANKKAEAEKDYLKWRDKKRPEYNGKYKSSVEALLEQLAKREFSYDISSDQVYKRYRDSVKTSAELALADAVGYTSALNGGYGTTYAQLAGQSAYYNTMKQADDMLISLYRDAYERFSDETDSLQYDIEQLKKLDDMEWDRYLQLLDEHNREGSELFERYTQLSDEEFNRFYAMYKLL